MNRTFIFGTVAAVLIIAGGLAYFFFFSRPSVTVSPVGSTSLPAAGPADNTTSTLGGTPAAPAPAGPVKVSSRLVKISAGPVVPGEAVVDVRPQNASSTPDVEVHYIERQSGNIYSYQLHAGSLSRTSNRTIPGIQSAAWTPSGSLALVRYLSGPSLETVNTYVLPANGGNGFFLAQNLADVAVSSSTILTLASGVNGSVASTERLDGSRSSQAFTTPLSKLRIALAGKSSYVAVTKASATLEGSAFLIDSAGHFSRIAGPLPGLTALVSPSGKWALVSYNTNGSFAMELVNTATGETTPLPVATLAEKCVWTADETSVYCGVPQNPPVGSYPDDWYQGAVSLTDRLWKINVAGRYAQLVLDVSKEAKEPIDVESLVLDTNESLLVFINKNTGALWSYAL